MNFGAGTAASSSAVVDDSLDTKPQLLNPFNNLAAVWPHQQQQSIAHQQELISASVDGPSATSSSFPPSNNTNTSPQSSSSNGGNNANHSSNDGGGDAEGVWSPDIDQAFHEALQIYPPCGRRKIILSDEGKMYGRNELIARYIKIRCGKTRTRKQVSSHIQVLARKKQREHQARMKGVQPDADFPMASDPMESLSPNPGADPNSVDTAASSNNGTGGPTSAGSASAANSTTSPPGTATIASNLNPNPANRDSSMMQQKLLMDAASAALSNSVMASGMPNPNPNLSPGNWPYPQSLLGAASNHNGIQLIAGNRSPHSLYSSLLAGAVHQSPATLAASPSCHASTFAGADITIASARLILCGFTAYIEQNLNAGGEGAGGDSDNGNSRVEIVRIPKTADAPLERITLDCVQSKYPALLMELFKRGPADAFFLAKCRANMRFDIGDQSSSLFAVDSFYESTEKFDIVVSTKVCSFGNEVVEKVEIYSPIDEEEEAKCSGVWHFRLEKSPMCEYMVRFISELKKLQEPALMNSVLENFTVLQIVTDKQSGHTLMAIAFMFEIREDGDDEEELSTSIYRIVE